MKDKKNSLTPGVLWGFIGAGQMGAAMMRGLVAAGLITPENIRFFDPDPERQKELVTEGFKATAGLAEIMEAEVAVLAVKPQVAGTVLPTLQELAQGRHLLISVVAGLSLAALEKALPYPRVIRAMPNTPLLVQAGMTALAPGSRASAEDVQLALTMFNALGRAMIVAEAHFDAVTALSGSGPAYVAVFLEALADGGVRMGLPRTLAQELALQTLLGTARLCQEKNLHPAILKDQVASPGGTTIAGLHALEQGGFRGLVMNAVEAATWRAQDLAAASNDR